jgi:acyl-CoA reductase-like NAD-dependent aldehyde dehydrogenase
MMELGGKNPAIVFPDVDLETAVQDVIVATFYNSGQACSDAERLLLHEDIYDEFLDAFADAVANLTVGDGRHEDTQIGPVINEDSVEKFHQYLDVAQDEGATVAAQAETPSDPETADGHWVPPTLLNDVDPQGRFAQEEVFGPVAGAIPFESEEEALEIANDVDYGLTATVWTQDISRAHRLASQLKVGGVGINRTAGGDKGITFGGYKRSGIGRKKDFEETMRAFTQTKSIQVDLTDEPSSL